MFTPYNIYALCYFHFRNHYLALWTACCELFPTRTVHLVWRFSPGSFKVSWRLMNLFESLGWFMGLTWTQVRLTGLCLRFWAHSCSNLKVKLTQHEPSFHWWCFHPGRQQWNDFAAGSYHWRTGNRSIGYSGCVLPCCKCWFCMWFYQQGWGIMVPAFLPQEHRLLWSLWPGLASIHTGTNFWVASDQEGES